MARKLDTVTLDNAARDYAAQFLLPSRYSRTSPKVATLGRDWVLQSLYNATFKDEHRYLVAGVKDWLGGKALAEFEALARERFAPRRDKVYQQLLAQRLAIDPAGNHIAGKIGRIEIGRRFIAMAPIEVESPESIRFRKWLRAQGREPGARQTIIKVVPHYWPVYAGETEERQAGSPVPDPLPPGADPWPVEQRFALNTRISNEAAIAACNAIVDLLDEGTGAAVIQGRSGAQPADPDTAATGTLLFTLVAFDPAFGNAVDANPGGRATANAVSDDINADFTATLGYCRASATNDGATPLDDHIDGEAGTATADFIFSTLSIVQGAVISLSSWLATHPEG